MPDIMSTNFFDKENFFQLTIQKLLKKILSTKKGDTINLSKFKDDLVKSINNQI